MPKIQFERSGGWAHVVFGSLLVLAAIAWGREPRLTGAVGVLMALLGFSIVRSNGILRALAERVLESDASEHGAA